MSHSVVLERIRHWRGLQTLVIVGSLLFAPFALAQDEPAPLAESLRGMARAEYAAARILYEDGDYAGALTKLRAAHGESNDPRLLWNMAACQKRLRHYAALIELLERYLHEGGALITEEDRESANQLLNTVGAFVNRLTIDAQPEGAFILIDGVNIGTTPLTGPIGLDMGAHHITIEKPGYIAQTSTVDLAGGKSLTLQVSLIAEVHEGTLRIFCDANGVIRVDGKVVGTSLWTGRLLSGNHNVRVTAPGKVPHEAEVLVQDGETSSLHINLRAQPPAFIAGGKPEGSGVWWWVAGSVAAAAGAGVGAYFVFRPGEAPPTGPSGTWGEIQL